MKERLFAIGDIHGCFKQLVTMIEKKIKLTSEDAIVFLGDYIDRGPQSKEVLDYIIALRSKGYNIIALLGNHEDMLLNALHDYRYEASWLYNGGISSLRSFNAESAQEIVNKYEEFFKSLHHYYIIDNYIFVHAGFNDKIRNIFDDKQQMLWSRQENFEHPMLTGKTVIHGHSVIKKDDCQKQIDNNSVVINIDTGCVFKDMEGCGVLTAVLLPDKRLFHVA